MLNKMHLNVNICMHMCGELNEGEVEAVGETEGVEWMEGPKDASAW